MSFDQLPTPPKGHLLARLGYIEEEAAAIAIDVSEQTMIEYRKKRIGPDYTVIGRTILYHPTRLQAWLEAGGTRAFEAEALNPPAKRGRAR
jgi:hypothetical protein